MEENVVYNPNVNRIVLVTGRTFYDDCLRGVIGTRVVAGYTCSGSIGSSVTQGASGYLITPAASGDFEIAHGGSFTMTRGFTHETTAALSTLTNVAICEIGMCDSSDIWGGPSTICMFFYDPSDALGYSADPNYSAANWMVLCGDGSAVNANTGVAASTAATDFKIVGDATSAKFYINGALVHTETSNLPGASTGLWCNWELRNGAGGSAKLGVNKVLVYE